MDRCPLVTMPVRFDSFGEEQAVTITREALAYACPDRARVVSASVDAGVVVVVVEFSSADYERLIDVLVEDDRVAEMGPTAPAE